MRPPNKYFVVPMGDELINKLIAENFKDALDYPLITIITNASMSRVQAWELELRDIHSLRQGLKTMGFDNNIHVAIQVNDGDIRWASREEYDLGYKRKKKLEKATRTAVGKTAVARAKKIQRRQALYVTLQPLKSRIPVPEHPELPLDDKKG